MFGVPDSFQTRQQFSEVVMKYKKTDHILKYIFWKYLHCILFQISMDYSQIGVRVTIKYLWLS